MRAKALGTRSLLIATFLMVANLGFAAEGEASSSAEAEIEEVIVTGSRIRRDAFSSASPIQVLDGAGSRDVGLIDTVSLLQSASQATGSQIDSTFTSFVLDNGPGSGQVNLRGLGANRVLLMLNSKRLAPGGVGGAPTSPDISTIPNILIDRIEYLLDGASSVYGSDAVSGVINVLMRDDFDGFEFEGQVVETDAGGGADRTFAVAWGASGANWTLGVAGEYYERDRLSFADHGYLECTKLIHEDQNGNRLQNFLGLVPGTTASPCTLDTVNRVFIPIGYGNVWYTPNETNIGIPNFSETEVPVGFTGFNPAAIVPIDQNGDGIPDTGLIDPDGDGLSSVDLQTDYFNYNGSPRERAADLFSGSERYNIYAYGEYDFGNDSNTSAYFEALFSNRKTQLTNAGPQLFPDVPANNPYNPCNQGQPNGVNCIGFFGGLNFGNIEVTPIVRIRGDRDNAEAEIEQTRLVGGLRGDLPTWQNDNGFGNWSYDAYVSYSVSDGTEFRHGILEPPLLEGINTARFDANGNIVCGDGTGTCVPVNMFAPSIYQTGGGVFGSQAETDFLFGVRAFDTEVEQTILSAVLQGDAFRLPWNDATVPLVLGWEWREDAIESRPNDVARDGLFFGFFSDGGATGDRNINEFFFESELPILEGVKYADELSLNLSARWTDESTYGSDTTYSLKGLYRPLSWLTFRGTYGTSFRAPNAREQFLVGQSGFQTVGDPCFVPTSARDVSIDPSQPDTYRPENDTRSQTTLDNCVANGVDPTTLGLDSGGTGNFSVEVLRKGGQQVQLDIDPETSTSITWGAIIDQKIWDDVTLRMGATAFDIEVEDSISLLGTQFVINDCYVENPGNTSGFCRFVKRDSDNFIEQVDSSFVNINTLISTGIDYNLFFQKDFVVNDRTLGFTFDGRMTRILSSRFVFEDADIDDASTPISPEWEGTFLASASYNDFTLNWRANYIGPANYEPEPFDTTNTACDTLIVACRPFVKTTTYWTHTASVSWRPRDWTVTVGLVNVFDERPPLIDNGAPRNQINNLQIGASYDVIGRRAFASVRKAF